MLALARGKMSKRPSPSEDRGKEKSAKGDPSSNASEPSLRENDLKRIIADSVAAQLPRLILETSKVVSEQMEAERGESSRSFTSFSQEMKKMRQRQEEIAIELKAAALKSDGKASFFFSFLHLLDKRARERARESERGRARGRARERERERESNCVIAERLRASRISFASFIPAFSFFPLLSVLSFHRQNSEILSLSAAP